MSSISITENSVLMARARESLKGSWGLAIGTCVVYFLVLFLAGLIPKVGGLISFLIAGPMAVGMSIFALSLSRKEDARLSQIFEGFKHFFVSLLAYIIFIIFVLLWSLLLIFPGIIAALAYSQVFFIIADDNTIGPLQAIRKSRQMMYGYKWKIFCLGFRFLGWGLLCILTFGIGFLWLFPYMNVSLAQFYDDIKDQTTTDQADKGMIWYENIYILLCITIAFGAVFYMVGKRYILPYLLIRSSFPIQETVIQPVSDLPEKVPEVASNITEQYTNGLTLYNQGHYKEAMESFRNLAAREYVDAQYYVGVMYSKGQGVDQNFQEAVNWYNRAAANGHSEAQNNLGFMYTIGQGVGKDYNKAVKWYTKAAEQGNLQAQYSLGTMYSKGQGVAQDYKEAVNWYRRSAAKGHEEAQNSLGFAYSEGQGVEQDYKEAVNWHRKAAEQGSIQAQAVLGLIYSRGQGVEQDYKEAVSWYQRSAAKGHA